MFRCDLWIFSCIQSVFKSKQKCSTQLPLPPAIMSLAHCPPVVSFRDRPARKETSFVTWFQTLFHIADHSTTEIDATWQHNVTRYTSILLRPLYRSTCVSQHPLRTGGVCWSKCYCPHALADISYCIWTREKTLEFSSMVLPAASQYCVN